MSMTLNQDGAVPDAYLGVWQRTLLRSADGTEDRTTRVFWIQTRHSHADLRVPDPAPVTVQARAALAGFAGLTRVEGDRCQWHRRIDFHPDSPADIGRMIFVSSEELHEHALDDSYREVWERLPDSVGPVQEQWLRAADNPRRFACLLQAGDYFLFAADRSNPMASGGPLAQRLESADAADAEAMLSCEMSMGRIRGASTPWHIQLSTLHGRAGRLLTNSGLEASEAWPESVWTELGAVVPAGGWQLLPVPALFSEEPSP
jgi:hypothetical protein